MAGTVHSNITLLDHKPAIWVTSSRETYVIIQILYAHAIWKTAVAKGIRDCLLTLVRIISWGKLVMALVSQPSRLLAKLRMAWVRVPEETEQPGLQTELTKFSFAESIVSRVVQIRPTAIQKIQAVLEQNTSKIPWMCCWVWCQWLTKSAKS